MSSNRTRRALRRAQLARRKAVVLRHVHTFSWFSDFLEDPAALAHYVGVSATTRARCSCWMCCSPRRLLKNSAGALTVQETRQGYLWVDWTQDGCSLRTKDE